MNRKRWKREPHHKDRRHHNNKGYQQIRRGRTADQVKRIAKRLGIPFE